MDTPATKCPAPETLRAFAVGGLPDADAEAVAAHLDACAACRQAATGQSGDSFVRRLRASGQAPETRPPATGDSFPATGAPGLGETAPYSGVVPGLPAELVDHPTYRVERELGRGGMGVVYLARNKMMDRPEVLKVMQERLAGRDDLTQRFIKEIQLAARVQHPNIATAYAAFRAGEALVLAMEFVDGVSLAELVRRKGPLPVAHACVFTRQVALGLQRAHEHGMVHRDIKPQNLMVTKRGEVKILDFGLAKVTSEAGDSGLTGSGTSMGTPDYMPPEQALDAKNADIRADIYSLGCTLYCLLTGKPPFAGRSAFEVMQAHQTQAAPALAGAPAELAELVACMLAKRPEERPQVPMEVAKALVPFCKAPEKAGAKPAVSLPPLPKSATAVPAGRAVPPLDVQVPPVPGSVLERRTAAPEPNDASSLVRPPRSRHRKSNTRRWGVVAGVVGAALVLLAVIVGLWAGGVLRTKQAGKGATNSRAERGEGKEQQAAPPQGTKGEGFKPLFNGRDLTGWREPLQNGGTWRIENGVLVGRGSADKHALLATTRGDFSNFHLRAEVCNVEELNKAIRIRSTWVGGRLTAYHVVLGGRSANGVIAGKGRLNGTLLGVESWSSEPTPTAIPVSQWYRIEIIASGNRLRVLVEGKTINDYEDTGAVIRSGQIELFLRPNAEVQFRTIEIQEDH